MTLSNAFSTHSQRILIHLLLLINNIKIMNHESLRNALNPDPEAFIWLNGDNVFNAECGHWQWRHGAA